MENQDVELLCTSPKKTDHFIDNNDDKLNRNFASFVEEEHDIESPPPNLFQTATTCLIPLPVYECTAQEWRLESPVQEWVEFETSKSKSYEALNIPVISQCFVQTANKMEQQETCDLNVLNNNNDTENKTINYSRSSIDGRNSRWITEERKSIDKQKRRKGMYIDHAEWDVSSDLDQNELAKLDKKIRESQLDMPDIKSDNDLLTLKFKEDFQNETVDFPSPTNEMEQVVYRHSPSNSKGSATDEQKRYSKRPLRGPYGQMLEAEMMKKKQSFEEQIENIQDEDRQESSFQRLRERNCPHYSNSMRVQNTNKTLFVPQHPRASSIPLQTKYCHVKDRRETHTDTQMERLSSFSSTLSTESANFNTSNKYLYNEAEQKLHTRNNEDTKIKSKEQLLVELLKGSSEQMLVEQRQKMSLDTRTHVVQEIFKNEQSYVESLQTVVVKYMAVLKSPECAGMVEARTVDEIFFMVPDILVIHEKLLSEFKARLDAWDSKQKVGDIFIEAFSKLEVLEIYTSFVNNYNRAKNAIRITKQQRPAFAKFLEVTAREHKGKLTLDNLLIKPVQKFPNYEMLLQRLIKHTDSDHPDQRHLQNVIKLVHDILVHINCKEREILENDQREATLRELEFIIEGITDLTTSDRQFLLFDVVSMPSGQGARKERGAFLFNDLLILTSVKKRSGTIRKPNTTFCPSSVALTLDTNKYKFLTKISLECLEIVKNKDDSMRGKTTDVENLDEDCKKLQQVIDIVTSIKYPHQYLEDVVRGLHREVQRQLTDVQLYDVQKNLLDLKVNSPNGNQKLSILFSKAEKRSMWEKSIFDAKQKIVSSLEKHQMPEFLTSIPIRKTRAGLQFTCAAATLSSKRDVWVCNSDGYVGQVCIMSLNPEPNVTSCNGVCNARILCLASVPALEDNTNLNDDKTNRCSNNKKFNESLKSNSSINKKKSPTSSSSSTDKKSLSLVSTDDTVDSGSGSVSSKSTNSTYVNNNGKKDRQLDLNLSSSDDETDVLESENSIPSPATSLTRDNTATSPNTSTSGISDSGKLQSDGCLHVHQNSNADDNEKGQSTMWIGTEDGCIHVYNSTDNIRIKKNRIKIELNSAVYSILYLQNRVFVSLANGNICVYLREGVSWNTAYAHCLAIGTATSPVSKLLNVRGNVWCAIQGSIKVLDIETLTVIKQTQISSDTIPITNMTTFDDYVWISLQNSALIKCLHYASHQLITEVNLAPVVNKMLSNCDEIIRQHKAACLRVTALLYCKGLIWIGTSAGVLLTLPAREYEKGAANIVPAGIPHGHTGHVRFLSFVELPSSTSSASTAASKVEESLNMKPGTDNADTRSGGKKPRSPLLRKRSKNEEFSKILVISGGDGYEDFRNSGINSFSEVAGREDSTNHLLIWQI